MTTMEACNLPRFHQCRYVDRLISAEYSTSRKGKESQGRLGKQWLRVVVISGEVSARRPCKDPPHVERVEGGFAGRTRLTVVIH